MSVGTGFKGDEVTVTVGSLTLLGTNNKGITLNNTPLDTTNDASSGWQERLAKSGVKSLEFPFTGILQNLELVNTYFGTSQIVELIYTFPDGSTITGDGFMDNVSIDPTNSNDLFTFSATFSSSGAPAFVAGT